MRTRLIAPILILALAALFLTSSCAKAPEAEPYVVGGIFSITALGFALAPVLRAGLLSG